MNRGKRRFAAAFLAPAVILYTVFVIVPIGMSAYYSLTDWYIGRAIHFVGLRNFVNLAVDPQYWTVVGNSFALLIGSVFIQVPVALVLAYVLFSITRGFRFFRLILFMPVVIAPIAIGLMFSILYNGDVGAINAILGALGLGSLSRSWLSDENTVLYAVMGPQIWQYVGLFMVIFLAALRGIPIEYFEAAQIDGASRPRMFFVIALPLLRETIVISAILAGTGALRAFDHSWAMTQGGPGVESAYYATLIYKEGFRDSQFGYASAISVTLLLAAVTLTVLARRFLLKDVR